MSTLDYPEDSPSSQSVLLQRLYQALLGNMAWMDDLHQADAIFIATHSQGSIVSTHLLDRLIRDKHIRTRRSVDTAVVANSVSAVPVPRIQKVCCLCLCGIHLGPLRYLRTNSVVLPYIQVSSFIIDDTIAQDCQYFESVAARELFEFQVRSSNYIYQLTHADSSSRTPKVRSQNYT